MNEDNDKNLVEEFLLEDNNGNRYRCAGVRVYDSDDQIQIAFNAIDNVVEDSIKVKKKYIISATPVPHSQIKKL